MASHNEFHHLLFHLLDYKDNGVAPQSDETPYSTLYIKLDQFVLEEHQSDGIYISKINLKDMSFYVHTPMMPEGIFERKDKKDDGFYLLVRKILLKVASNDFTILKK